MRALAICAALLLACARTPGPLIQASPSPEPGVVEVTALLDLSGSGAALGAAQRNALDLWVDLDRARGARVPLRLSVVDVGTSEARLLIELRRAAEGGADAAIVGVPVDLDRPGFLDIAQVAQLPLLLTLPVTEPSGEEGGRWLFAFGPTPEQIARRVIGPARTLIDTFVVARDDRGIDAETDAVLSAYGRVNDTEPGLLRVDPAEPATIQAAARVVAAGGSRVHVMGAPRDWAAFAQTVKQLGRPVTRYVLSYLTEPADGGEFRDGLDASWPAPRNLSLGAIAPDGAAAARRQFVESYASRHGAPSAHAGAAFDALTALALAAERAGADSRERLRERLEATAFAGVSTTYAFSMTRHAGYGGDDLALYRWRGGVPIIDTRP